MFSQRYCEYGYAKALIFKIIGIINCQLLYHSMKVKKHLSLQPLIDGFKQSFSNHEDTRRKNSVNYSILDTALSGLACMFYKSGSLVNYQRNMEHKYHQNNLQTQFGVTSTPKDNQMRKIIGSISHQQLAPVFSDYLKRLQRGKHLEKFRFQDKYLVAIDGTEYYSSDSIDCSCCLTQTKRNGDTRYYHKVLQPIICHPDCKQILPLMPEEIKNTDGTDKQDCEVAAANRLLPAIRKSHPKMKFI